MRNHALFISLETRAARISNANIFLKLYGKITFIIANLLISGEKERFRN